MNLIIRKAKIIDTKSPYHNQIVDLKITDGVIEEIGDVVSNNAHYQEFQKENLHLSQGWLDTSVSLGEPGFEDRETIANGLEVAAKSGFTGIALQPNSFPIIDNQSGEPMLFPWLYNPLLSPSSSHPIGKNLDPILSRYASHIDTIENNIQKHVILSSSQYGRFLPDPVRVHLAAIKEKPNLKYFNKPFLPAGVLLEGNFESLYKNRIKPEALDKLEKVGAKTSEKSVNNRMIILSDGDLIQNFVSQKGEQYPLGFEIYSGQTFANADFLKNCVEYLIDEQGLLTARNKEIKLRMLDKKRTEDPKEALKWQLFNILVPILLILIFGIIYHYVRKRKWTS